MGNRLQWMFLVIVEITWTSFPTMEHVVGLLTGLLTYSFSTFMSATILVFWTIGLLREPSKLSLAMDNMADLGKTISRDNIKHDGATLQTLCVGS
jgi:hypothetical protein